MRVCVCVCVWKCVALRFWDNNRRFVCGLYTAEDNVSSQVCVDQTLHRQPHTQPFFCLSTLPVHLNPPTTPQPQGSFWEMMAVTIASIVSVFFCEVRTGLGALCLSLHIPCSTIYRLALQALEGSSDRGGRYRWSKDQPWIVSPQNKPKCKHGEEIFKRRPLNCVPNRMSTVAVLFCVGRKMKWEETGQDKSREVWRLCLQCIWARLSAWIASLPAGLWLCAWLEHLGTLSWNILYRTEKQFVNTHLIQIQRQFYL